MTDLLHFIDRIGPASLKRAPLTIKSTWASGESPYKVVLLVSVIVAMHQKKAFRGGIIYYADCLPIFKEVYSMLYPGDVKDIEHKIAQPFWYFGSGRPRTWRLVPNDGKSSDLHRAIVGKKQITTAKMLNELVQCAEMDGGDHDLLQNSSAARSIVYFLTSEYLGTHSSYNTILALARTLK